jgi:hypothetical protein
MTPSKANNATIMNSNVIEVDEIPNNKLKWMIIRRIMINIRMDSKKI